MKTLATSRLLLRPFAETDTEDLYAYACDPEVGPRAGWKPHANRTETLSVIRSFIEKDDVWAIERKTDSRVIGSLGLHRDKWRTFDDARMLGYVLACDCWGCGYMPEAVNSALAYGFDELALKLMSVSHFSFNDRSRRVIEKCGFTKEGVIRRAFCRYDGALFDECIYSMTKDEWEARHK